MGSMTLEDMGDLLHKIGIKFDKLLDETRITLAFCYVLIIVTCAIVNDMYL